MSQTIEERLGALKLELPSPAAPVANYSPFMIDGPRLYISGQMPVGPDGIAFKGHLGGNLDVEQGRQAARLCAINILAQAKAALGDLERITQCLKLAAYVSCTPDFVDHPQVVNGASDLIVEVLGDKGRHARLAVGVAGLPLDAAVEVEALMAVS